MTNGFESQGQDSTLYPHHHLFFYWCFSKHRKPVTPQNASGSLGASVMERDAVPVLTAALTTNSLLFAPLWQVQLGVSSQVTWAASVGGGGECGHWAVPPEGLQQKWWPLRDGMLTCVGGMLALCSHYLLWVMVTTFVFCFYNRPVFKKHMATSLNNLSSNVGLCNPCLLGEKRTLGFSLT